MTRAAAVVDLGAITANLARLRELAGDATVMAVVKADAYGHGMAPVARAARGFGVEWLGVALPSEALALRAQGDTGRVLAWLWSPGDPCVADCVRQDVDLSVSSGWALAEVADAARVQGVRARIHLKVDTGLSRNGIPLSQFTDVVRLALDHMADGLVEVVGIWSHLADGDTPGAPSAQAQFARFTEAVDAAAAAGIGPVMRHLSNSGALWAHPEMRFDLVRTGIAMYGLTPAPVLGSAAELGLVPAMSLVARLAHVKAAAAGTAVSYGGAWTADRPTTLGLVPVGYADGIPRAAGNRIQVAVAGRPRPMVGRVAMDQFVVDLGDEAAARVGDDVYVFGPGTHGEWTADDWAAALDTIGYEIVTRIGPRVPREYVQESP